MLRMLGGLCYQCNLEKYECLNCENQFIVGMEMRMRRRNSGELWCPYCRSENVDRLAYTDDDTSIGQFGAVGSFLEQIPMVKEWCRPCVEFLNQVDI